MVIMTSSVRDRRVQGVIGDRGMDVTTKHAKCTKGHALRRCLTRELNLLGWTNDQCKATVAFHSRPSRTYAPE